MEKLITDDWQTNMPYAYLLDDVSKVAYPINRHYKNLGNNNREKFIPYPNYNRMEYMYGSRTRPYKERDLEERERLEKGYYERRINILEGYSILNTWDFYKKQPLQPLSTLIRRYCYGRNEKINLCSNLKSVTRDIYDRIPLYTGHGWSFYGEYTLDIICDYCGDEVGVSGHVFREPKKKKWKCLPVCDDCYDEIMDG